MKVKGIREKHVLREAARDVLIPEVYDRQKHPFTSPPTRDQDDPMMGFYHDTFASQAARVQPIYDMDKGTERHSDQLLSCPDDQRIAAEGDHSAHRQRDRHAREVCDDVGLRGRSIQAWIFWSR